MATNISKKTGRREVGGQPPPPLHSSTNQNRRRDPPSFSGCRGLASWQILHNEWCQDSVPCTRHHLRHILVAYHTFRMVALPPKSKSTASNAKPIKFLNAVHR